MLKLTRKHSAGLLKVRDRKKEIGADGKETGKHIEVIHRLSPNAYGKPVEVNDEEYVLSKHGAILEKM